MENKIQKVIKRYAQNPILSASNLPYASSLVFNAGVMRFRDQYLMVFRNDVGFTPEGRDSSNYTNLGIAISEDGLTWRVHPRPWLEKVDFHPEIRRIYDPRLTVIEDHCYLCFAADTANGTIGGIGEISNDFDRLKILNTSLPDNRNMVLFPEKIAGRFMRLERPFPEYSLGYKEQYDIWVSSSVNGRDWGDISLVLSAAEVSYCNSKIGPGAPPVRTSEGWLTMFHAVSKVDRELFCWGQEKGIRWKKEYQAGLMLLDLQDPTKVIGLCPAPVLTSRKIYENQGYRGSVIFPGGMILEDNGEVKIYYGAADTVECLATAQVDDLLELCLPVNKDHHRLHQEVLLCNSPFNKGTINEQKTF